MVDSGVVMLLKREKRKCTDAFGIELLGLPKLIYRAHRHITSIKSVVGKGFNSIIKELLGKGSRRKRSGSNPATATNGLDGETLSFGRGLKLKNPSEDDCVNFGEYMSKEWGEMLDRPNAPVDGERRGPFSMKYEGEVLSAGASDPSSSSIAKEVKTDHAERGKISLESVVEELSLQFGDGSDGIIQSLFAWLLSERSNESLQNDVSSISVVDIPA
jgi:hypothetical protein